MPLTQGNKLRRFQKILYFSLLLGLMPFSGTPLASAGFTGLSLGVSYPTVMGNAYQTLMTNTPVGFQGKIWMDASWIASGFQLHSSLYYEPLIVRNFSNIHVDTVTGFVGLEFQNGEFGTHFTPFFAADVGVMYDRMHFTDVTTESANAAMSFANQFIAGFDLPVYGRFGLVGEFPIRIIYIRNILVVLDPSISVRFKL